VDKYSNNSAEEGREDEGISKIKMMIKEALNKERR
jgi:predicted transposase YbfD/YdcC